MNSALKHVTHECDLCIVGAGLAGTIAAISAARHGTHVIVMQDRPMAGGNASSEIRMWVRGASGGENREGGILRELELENIYRNPTMNFTLWDSVIYDKLTREPNIEVLFDCSCADAETSGNNIVSVTGWQLTTYTWHTVKAKYFADCSGDSILAPIVGAEFRVGRESKAETGEYLARETADLHTMGMSCVIQARQTDHECKFIAPDFAYVYDDDDSFTNPRLRDEHDKIPVSAAHKKSTGKPHDPSKDANFWWIELGGEVDSIADTEKMKEELIKCAFGVWDHIKNRGDHGAADWELEWIGFLPGKRESRRYVGDYVLKAEDLRDGRPFDDTIAYGGWTMDDHNPAGILKTDRTSILYPVHSPYPIPYRTLYSVNIGNLFFAGRNISTTHMALSSTRVMATCSLLGQAMGTAAALAHRYGTSPRGVYEKHIKELQSILMEDECRLPGFARHQTDFAASCRIEKQGRELTEAERSLLSGGIERPEGENENIFTADMGDTLEFILPSPSEDCRLRIVFDPDYTRESISSHVKYKLFAMKAQTPLDFKPLNMPATLIKDFTVVCTGKDGKETIAHTNDNHRSLAVFDVPDGTLRVGVTFNSSYGCDKVRLFACDVDKNVK